MSKVYSTASSAGVATQVRGASSLWGPVNMAGR